jgi:uncharacterized protein
VLKAVIDTNVWISSLIQRGNPSKLLDIWTIEDSFAVYYPLQLIEELRSIPSKQRLASRIHSDDVHKLIAFIEDEAILAEPEHVEAISRDPNDDVFLACALFVGADVLVTGDKDLLVLGEYASIHIITPTRFLEMLARIR